MLFSCYNFIPNNPLSNFCPRYFMCTKYSSTNRDQTGGFLTPFDSFLMPFGNLNPHALHLPHLYIAAAVKRKYCFNPLYSSFPPLFGGFYCQNNIIYTCYTCALSLASCRDNSRALAKSGSSCVSASVKVLKGSRSFSLN